MAVNTYFFTIGTVGIKILVPEEGKCFPEFIAIMRTEEQEE